MAGIGEASAVAATIQIGVSLTKTLVAVVSDYRSAREDINNIATEVNATLKQAEELDHIVADNVRTKRLNHRGLQLALKCKTDSERIVQKLIKLLTKAEVPGHELYTFKVEDIEVSKFRSAAWHFWKPKLEVIKRELDSIRIQILLAHICISAKSAPGENERAALENLVPGLQRSRRLAHRLVREAQARSNKAEQSDMSNRGVEPHPAPVSSGLSFPPSHVNHRVERSSMPYPGVESYYTAPYLSGHGFQPASIPYSYHAPPPPPPETRPSSPRRRSNSFVDRDTEKLAKELREELEQELLAKLQQKVDEQDAIQALNKKLREEAVEGYKHDTRQRLSAIKERSAETRQRLLSTFTTELPDSEVQTFLNAQHNQELKDDFVELMIDSYKAPNAEFKQGQDFETASQRTVGSRSSTKR